MTKAKISPHSLNPREGNVGCKAKPTPKPAKIAKKAWLINLLSKKPGSDVADISKRFGWLPHTTRAALIRLRNSGYEISSMKPGTGKPTKYRITSSPAEQSAQ